MAANAHEGEIGWLTSSEAKVRQLRDGVFSGAGLRATGAISGLARRLRVVSADPADAIPQANLVILAVPAYAHRQVLERICPYLRDDAVLGFAPARAGLEFELGKIVQGIAPHGNRTVFGLQTLPWLCRVREVGRHIEVMGVKSRVFAAVLPGGAAADLVHRMTRLFGIEVLPLSNFLNLTLGNPGQVIHTGRMYALFGRRPGRTYHTEEIPRFYEELDQHAALLIDALSKEVVAVARAIEEASGGMLDLSGVLPIQQWLRMSYPREIRDCTTLLSCFRTNEAYRGVRTPMWEVSPGVFEPDFDHRFLAEDVPCGLVVVRAVAELVGVATSVIDEVIDWAQQKLGRQYLVDGRLRGRDMAALRIPQNHGIHSARALIQAFL